MKIFASTMMVIFLAFSGITAEAKAKKKPSPGFHKAAAYINAGKRERKHERKHEKLKKKLAKNKKPLEKKKIAKVKKSKKISEKRKVANASKHKKNKKH